MLASSSAAILIRDIGGPTDDNVTPQVPHLAALCKAFRDRPLWQQSHPIAVDPDTFAAAEREMIQLRRAQGYNYIAMDGNIRAPNFLLYGVPVICGEEP